MTKPQREALEWLIGHSPQPWRGGDLVAYYQARAEANGDPHRATTNRSHAWRRTGGRVLAGMEAAGLVRRSSFSHGTSLYVLTDAGREALDAT